MEQSSKDLSEAAYEEQENLEQDSFLDAPVAAGDITIETPTTAIDDEIPTKIRVSNLYNEINKSRSALIALPTTTSAGRSSEEEAEEEEENMYMELGKLPSSADPEKMAKLQERLSQLAEEQMRSFRRSGLQKANMKKGTDLENLENSFESPLPGTVGDIGGLFAALCMISQIFTMCKVWIVRS